MSSQPLSLCVCLSPLPPLCSGVANPDLLCHSTFCPRPHSPRVHGLVLPSFCISQRHSISKSGLSLFNRSTSAPSCPRRISSRSYKLHLSSLPLETPGLSLHARPSWTLGNGRDRFRSCFVTPFFQLRRGSSSWSSSPVCLSVYLAVG